MRRITIGLAAAASVVALAGCSQVAQLKPVAGDAVIFVRTATIDAATDAGITFRSAPVCTYSGNNYNCEGVATDGRSVTSAATSMTIAELPADLKPTPAPGDQTSDSDKAVVIEVKAGDQSLYKGLVKSLLAKEARTQ